MSMFARGMLRRVVTRVYFDDESAANESDPLLVLAGRDGGDDAGREGRRGGLPVRPAAPGCGPDRRSSMSQPTDVGLLSPVSAGTVAESLTGDDAVLAAMVRAEAALLTALAASGVAPGVGRGGRRLAGVGAGRRPRRWRSARCPGGNPTIPLVPLLRAAVPEDVARWVHFGATSQDIVDTALMLVASDVLRQVESRADVARVLPRHAVRLGPLRADGGAHADPAGAAHDARLPRVRVARRRARRRAGGPDVHDAAGVAGRTGRPRVGVRLTRAGGAVGVRGRARAAGTGLLLAHPPDAGRGAGHRADRDRCRLRQDRRRPAGDGADRGRRGARGQRRGVVVDGAQGEPDPVGAGGLGRAAAARARLGPRRVRRRRAGAARRAPGTPSGSRCGPCSGWPAVRRRARRRTCRRWCSTTTRCARNLDLLLTSLGKDSEWAAAETAHVGVWIDRVLAQHEEVFG